MQTTIEEILKKSLAAAWVEVTDDSHQHKGHSEAIRSGGGHFSVLVISDQFEEKSLTERHRMVYDALKDHLKEHIHALAIKTYTTKEYATRN